MEIDQLERHINNVQNFYKMSQPEQIDYIAYFLTAQDRAKTITSTEIDNLLELLDMRKYARLSAYLSENSTNKSGKYVKKDKGYRLEKTVFDEIDKKIKNTPERVEVTKSLQELSELITDPIEINFLSEALNCYQIQANRAAVVMTWNLTFWHLKKYIFEKKLTEFNLVLKKAALKELTEVIKPDDFDKLKESKIIELTASANIISGNIKKILNDKLDTRNIYAHPSSVTLSGHKATEYMLELIKEIILKY